MELHEQDIEESDGFKGLYSYVYDSQRPEIFFRLLDIIVLELMIT